MLLTSIGSSHTQLQELEEKYSECIEMLHEAQEELKNLRNRSVSAGTPRHYHPLGLFPMVNSYTYTYTHTQLHNSLKYSFAIHHTNRIYFKMY